MNVHHKLGWLTMLAGCAAWGLFVVEVSGQEIVDQWRFVLKKPAEGWQKTSFDDSAWEKGQGGFGEPSTPGARMGTSWTTPNIWLRKEFEVKSLPAKPALYVHHDEDAEIYVNGRKIASLPGYSTEYKVVPIAAEEAKALVVGKNSLAVQLSSNRRRSIHRCACHRCRQSSRSAAT